MFIPILKRISLSFSLLICVLSASGQSAPSAKYPTLLWKISGNGLSKPSYLYGTMHVSKKLVYHLSDRFFDAIHEADVIGLETNPGTWISEMEKYGMFDAYNFSKSYYSNKLVNFYEDAFKVQIPNNKGYSGMIAFDPDLVNGLLYRFGNHQENFEESTYIDLFIFQAASKWNKKVVSLENFKTSMIKGKLGDLPDINPETGEVDYDYSSYQSSYGSREKIEDAYRRGNLDELDSLSKVSGRTKNFQKYLLEDRNEVFVHNMDSIMKHQSLFTGVGAAHLPGDKGVIELLRRKGYTVEPVYPGSSRKGDKTKEEIDEMFKPVSALKQYAQDSLFTYTAPGKLVTIANSNSASLQLYADMVNGAFYNITRVKTFAPVYGYDMAKMKLKIDSLLYENIPGKILTKTELKQGNDWIGYDITNETRRGDLQRYQIYISDIEMIIFKLGGKGDYVKKNDAKQFFNSIQFTPRAAGEKMFSPVNKGFEVRIPETYFYGKSYGAQNIGISEGLTAYDKSRQVFYGVSQVYYNDFNYIEEDTFELNIMTKNVLKNFNFKENQTRKLTSSQGLPAIEFSGVNTSTHRKLYGKLVIKGVHYYLAYAIGPDNFSYPESYFKSFNLVEYNYTNERKIITDRTCMFTAKDEVTENTSNEIDNEVNAEYERLKNSATKKQPDNSFDNNYLVKSYFSPSSGEHVNIEFEKFNDYDHRNRKEVWDNIKKYMIRTTNARVTDEKKSEDKEKGICRYEFVLKDTNSARVIKNIYMFKAGAYYAVAAPYDTTIGMQGWTKDFLDTYAPMDSVIGKNIFDDKFTYLVTDLKSADSTKRAQAETSLEKYYFEKENLKEFIDLLNDKDLSKISANGRAVLFVNGGTLNDEKVIPVYKNLYGQYNDSSYLQICLIKGLGYLHTKNAYAAISQQLVSEPPLVGSEETVNDVFSVFYDSLELCKSFFPGLLKLTEFNEYKQSVYNLLSALVAKKLIAPADYMSWKNNLLTEANYELKRYNAANSGDKKNGDEQSKQEAMAQAEADALLESLKYSQNANAGENTGSSSTSLYYEMSAKPLLVKYALLLAPQYKTDAGVKNWFSKLYKVKSDNVLLPVYVNLLQQGVNDNDTVWTYFSKKTDTRIMLYNALSKIKKTEYFKKDLLTQESFCEAFVQQHMTSYDYSDDDKDKNEKIELLKILDVHNRYEKGKIYVYKRPESKYKVNRWAYVFVKDKPDVSTDIELIESDKTISKDKAEKEYLDEIADDFSLRHRRRAQKNYGYNTYGENYED